MALMMIWALVLMCAIGAQAALCPEAQPDLKFNPYTDMLSQLVHWKVTKPYHMIWQTEGMKAMDPDLLCQNFHVTPKLSLDEVKLVVESFYAMTTNKPNASYEGTIKFDKQANGAYQMTIHYPDGPPPNMPALNTCSHYIIKTSSPNYVVNYKCTADQGQMIWALVKNDELTADEKADITKAMEQGGIVNTMVDYPSCAKI